jgi:hypothetical protein
MIVLIFYYLVLPFILAGVVLKLVAKYGKSRVPPEVAKFCRQKPIARKFFRALEREGKGLKLLGDYETHDEAVEWAYTGRKQARESGRKAVFWVTNDKGEILDQVDS